MMNKQKLKTVALVLMLIGAIMILVGVSKIEAKQDHKIRICHATDSHTNPYTNPEVDQDAVDGDLGNDNGQGDHYLEHNGEVWHEGIADHSWGDIIPPIEGVHEGKNWNEEGRAFWNNSCNIVVPSPTPEVSPSASPSASPTVSPIPSPSLEATPSPTPSVTPSPTPTTEIKQGTETYPDQPVEIRNGVEYPIGLK
jgi:hypothetical protein